MPQSAQQKDRRLAWRAALLSAPGILWVLLFLAVPMLLIVGVSFLTRGVEGQVQLPLTGESYKRFIGYGAYGFDPIYPQIIVRSLVLGLATTALCVVLALPLAFFIANLPARFKTAALTMVVIPLWINLLIRTYAWQIILAADSPLSRLAAAMGVIPERGALYPGVLAVYAGMVCDYLPFLVLPLYASVEKLDWSLAEAARDLGANAWGVFRHALLPQIMPGLVAGCVLVFIPATGQFVIPDLLGGAKTVLLGNAIQQEFGSSLDWPFGSAITVLSMGLVLAGLWLYARTAARRGQEELL